MHSLPSNPDHVFQLYLLIFSHLQGKWNERLRRKYQELRLKH